MAKYSTVFGSYLGEAIRLTYGAEWGMVTMDGNRYPGMQFNNGWIIWPMSKSQKRIANGPEDNVWSYFQALKGKAGEA